MLSIFLFACFSPESDGIKAAKKYSDCERELTELRIKYYSEFINNFSSYHFQTRIEARRKMQEITDKINVQYNISLEKAERYYHEVSGKYTTNKERNNIFQYAFQGYRDNRLSTEDTIVSLMSHIDNLIYTIIPNKHDIQNLKNDLVGRKISEGPDGYRGQNWYWEIKSANEIEITEYQNIEDIGNDYKVNAKLILHGENSDYMADVIVYYVLRNYDDWTIDVIETKNMQIVQTHKYNNFITVNLWGLIGEHNYDFINSSDVSLLIGGVTLSESYNRWDKFSIVVNANSKATIGGFRNRIKDCKIHFIERP
jgi:hypothetical protein